MYWLAVAVAVTLVVVLAALTGPLIRDRRRENQLRRARSLFHLRREWLEARFLTLASQSGLPRGLSWVNCEFSDDVAFARDRIHDRLTALVAVTISFEAIEGGGMEDVEAVGNLRAATAVFYLQDCEWRTDGRALFNLNPAEAIARLDQHLETVD